MHPVTIRYYTVNDRPAKIIPTADGGADMLVLDMLTGVFRPDRSYFSRVTEVGKDVESLDETRFNLVVAAIRREIATNLQTLTLAWHLTGDGEFPYRAEIQGCVHTIRVNDFPAEPLYTLLVEGEPVADLEDWPTNWSKLE